MADSHPKPRTSSISQASEGSQTAADFIKEQLSLEAEAREALPYQFDTCTRDLGPLRQGLYSCLTCNPPPPTSAEASNDDYVPAAVCYACSISCHGEHTLVELFNKRNFVCDCGTTRLPESTPCTLRVNQATGQKGDVKGEGPAESNKYNHNFRNKFCGCGEEYDPHQEKGTMFQCLGLSTSEEGGCGEDWWHPECVLGLAREDFQKSIEKAGTAQKVQSPLKSNGFITKEVSFTRQEEEANEQLDARRPSITTAIAAGLMNGIGVDGNDVTTASNEREDDDDDDAPLPPGFPPEDEFEFFLCYKCVEINPWIKKYAGAPGFLPPVYFDTAPNAVQPEESSATQSGLIGTDCKKRKATDGETELTVNTMGPPKRQKSEDPIVALSAIPETTTLPISPKKQDPDTCKLLSLPPLPNRLITTRFSLFMKPNFHEHLCHCTSCFPLLKPHPQLLEEEDVYEPPMSEDGEGNGEGSVGTGSLLDRGEAAFNNMDRVRAIQGAKAYAHLKDNLKAFLQPFAESGQAVGAEDIKAYFEKLRGDEQGIKDAAGGAAKSRENDHGEDGDGGDGADNRKEQSGY
ncbi:hypothetical protein BS50DRAFT_557159 [Corynespora cassiicola Philippines]|uniref:UBR-type domain-containing protein n=1 Tax=Corynespora cassiicola Philippines TaxID=1448308 RepID=A0A2T2NGK5_CORCC|nr:hypothetical protein BS50DRAFT_557159 [Corynespora cassiicola Philippines]